jgi:hypothetical protein
MIFDCASFPAIGQRYEARVADDRPAFGHHGCGLIVRDKVNGCRDTLSRGGRRSGQKNKHREQRNFRERQFHFALFST